MTFSHRPGRAAMLATVSPAILMLSGLLVSGASAEDHVVNAETTLSSGIVLDDGDSLTNDGTITNNGGSAVGAPANVTFIINGETGEIEASGNFAIGINGNLGSFENHGVVTTDSDAALGVGGNLGSFVNTGTMTSTDRAGVGVNGSVGSFDNSGTITGTNDPAAAFNGAVGTFVNSGTMSSGAGWTSVYFDQGATSISNSGTITNTGTGKGLEANLDNAAIGSVDNSGTITGGTGQVGVGLFGDVHDVGTFTNSGTITGQAQSAVAIDAAIGSFTNSGTLNGGNWEVVYLGKGVTNFVNTSTGVIENLDHNGNGGNGVGINTGTTNGGAVGSFENHGIIKGDLSSADSSGVGFFRGGDPTAFQVGSFTNTGTITGQRGVDAAGGFGTFFNSGTISSIDETAFWSGGAVESFTNTGTISSEQGSGLGIDGDVATFTNSGTIDSFRNGVTFNGSLGTGSNSGTIISRAPAGEIGVRINEPGSVFTNSGTIEGATAVAYILGSNGPSTLVNSGTLRGTNGHVVSFDNGDDLLKLRTGSKIFGEIGFNGGDDTVDVSGFAGNTLLRVYGLENVITGDRLVHFDQPNDLLAVVEANGITRGGQTASIDMATQFSGLITPVLDGALSTGTGANIEPLGYMPVAPQTAADLAIIEPPASTATVWATAIGGGSHDAAPVGVNSLYGALVAGTHAMLAPDTTLGVMAGVGRGNVDINSGGQSVDSLTGIAGLYGRHDMGGPTIDFSLMAGVSGHQSSREVVALGALETARADYASWFVSPALALAVPVIEMENGAVDLVGKVSYVGGQVAGYTETGSSLNLTVGSQTFGLIDARIGLAAEMQADESGASKVTVNGGVFAQSNVGSTSVPVSFLGQTQNAAAPTGTELGLYGGIGMTAQLNQSLRLTAGADAQVNFNGQFSGALRAGLASDF